MLLYATLAVTCSSSLSPKRGKNPLIFGPCLLWPNGWMSQDRTWHGGRPRPRPHCARWGPSSPPQIGEGSWVHVHQFSAHVYYGQTWRAGRPGPWPHYVRWRPSSPSPNFRPISVCCGQMVGWIKMPLGVEVGFSPGHIVLDEDPAAPKRLTAAQFSAHFYCGLTAGRIKT